MSALQGRHYELTAFSLDRLHCGKKAARAPGPNEVRLEMRAWSLNYRDLMIVKGTYNPRMKLPMQPLSDGVGEVSEVGPGVTRVKNGDRVAGIFTPKWLAGDPGAVRDHAALGGGAIGGVAAEQVILHEDSVVLVPPHLSDEEAATLPCAAVTAWHALEGLRAGDTILTEGTGGVSLFALQFAQLAGARVIATTSSEAKARRLEQLGTAAVVNYRTEPNWGDKAREFSGGAGVDRVIEVGGAGNMPQAVKALRVGGKLALIGVLAGGGDFNPTAAMMKQISISGIVVGSRLMFEQMNRAIAQHRLQPIVDRVFAFSELADALLYLESGAHFGKVCLRR